MLKIIQRFSEIVYHKVFKIMMAFSCVIFVIYSINLYGFVRNNCTNCTDSIDTLSMINVGQGDGFLVNLSSGHRILIDTGNNSQKIIDGISILPLHANEKILDSKKNKIFDVSVLSNIIKFMSRIVVMQRTTLDLVIITHDDADHVGSLNKIFERYRIGGVLSSSLKHGFVENVFKNISTEIKEVPIKKKNKYSQSVQSVTQRNFDIKKEDQKIYSKIENNIKLKLTSIARATSDGFKKNNENTLRISVAERGVIINFLPKKYHLEPIISDSDKNKESDYAHSDPVQLSKEKKITAKIVFLYPDKDTLKSLDDRAVNKTNYKRSSYNYDQSHSEYREFVDSVKIPKSINLAKKILPSELNKSLQSADFKNEKNKDISTPANEIRAGNEHSLIFNFIINQTKILFTGDAGKNEEKIIMKLDSDITKSMERYSKQSSEKYTERKVDERLKKNEKANENKRFKKNQTKNYNHEVYNIHYSTDQEILNLLGVDILKIGHHGSKTSTSYNFMKLIHPNYALISAGYKNRYGHPHKGVMKIIDTFVLPKNIIRTDICGTFTFTMYKGGALRHRPCTSDL